MPTEQGTDVFSPQSERARGLPTAFLPMLLDAMRAAALTDPAGRLDGDHKTTPS